MTPFDQIGRLFTAQDIPANSNLNSYTTVGIYSIDSSSTAATISNVPAEKGGMLKVEPFAANGDIIQTFRTRETNFNIYQRTLTVSSSNWASWKKIAQTLN